MNEFIFGCTAVFILTIMILINLSLTKLEKAENFFFYLMKKFKTGATRSSKINKLKVYQPS